MLTHACHRTDKQLTRDVHFISITAFGTRRSRSNSGELHVNKFQPDHNFNLGNTVDTKLKMILKKLHRSRCRETMALLALLCLKIIGFSSAECACELHERPDPNAKAETARWMVHSLNWGVVSTISSRLGGDGSPAIPFGNVYSFVDGPCDKSTGVPYLYGTYMDQSFSDTKSNDMISLTLSESSLSSVCPNEALDSCSLGPSGDPENPMCARLTLTGKLVVLDEDTEEHEFAKDAFFERHPTMARWPKGHGWVIAKIVIEDIWLISFFGGATILDPKDYFAARFSVVDIYE